MTEERLNLMEIFDKIINNDGMWDEIKFTRSNSHTLKIVGIDQYGSKFTWSEELQ